MDECDTVDDLLPSDSPLLSTKHRALDGRLQSRQWYWLQSPVGVHYLLLSFGYLALLISAGATWWQKSCECSESRPLTPQDELFPSLFASKAVKYERRPFEISIHNNPFAGDPRPELDRAWHGLFEDIRIRVSSEDLAFYNTSSLPLADGDGYASELGVHHELHCLKKIRHWIFRDYYLQDETAEELVEYKAHVHHCLELMRESIMCRADPSLTSFEWQPGNPPHLTAVAVGWHRCVNWDSLLEWVRAKRVKVFEPGVVGGLPKES